MNLISKITIFAALNIQEDIDLDKAIKRIVIIGPESTGKSTLTSGLARYFDTVFAEEYARGYLELLSRPYNESDLLLIAERQVALEDERASKARNGLLFCDTDLQVMKVWMEDKYGRCATWVLEQIACRKYDLYLLTDIDMAWQDDPLREHPEPEMRAYFFHIYNDIVQHSGIPFVRVSGNEEDRLQTAITAIKQLFPGYGTST